MASNKSVIDLMNLIAAIPAVDGNTRVRAATLAHQIGSTTPFSSIFEDFMSSRGRTPR